MRKFLTIACALAMASTAVPAFAAVQSVRVGGFTNNTFVHRQNFDLGRGSGGTDKQDVFIDQTGLKVDADLTDQVAATVALITERPWNNDNTSTSSNVDLYLAYVTLREMLYSPLTLVVGRQQFSFGNGLIFDATGSNNAAPGDSGIQSVAADLTLQTSVDAIRAILDYNPLTITAFYSALNQNTVTISTLKDNVDIWGLNANYQLGDDMDSVVEGYFFLKRDKSNLDMHTGAKTDYVKVVGIRASTNPIEGLNLQAEFAHQGGSKAINTADYSQNRHRNAFAVQAIVNYQVPYMQEYKPVAQYVYTKVTGDTDTDLTDSNRTDYTGWDPFFEAQGGGRIYNALFNLTNMQIHELSLTTQPMEDVTAKLGITGIWLERDLKMGTSTLPSVMYTSPDGVSRSYSVNPNEKYLGKELDLDLTYNYTEDVQFGASVGWFFPGGLFTADNNSAAKQLLLNMNVSF